MMLSPENQAATLQIRKKTDGWRVGRQRTRQTNSSRRRTKTADKELSLNRYSLPLTKLAAQNEFSQLEKFVEAEQAVTMT